MSAKQSIAEMIADLEQILGDAEKHDRGIDAAGARVRKQLMETKKGCDALRKQVQEERNARKG